MKAIVMETRKNEAAVLLKDGTFRITTGRYTVGETIEYRENARPGLRRWIAAAAALVLMLVTGGGFWYDANRVAYGEISLDASASIVYTVNKQSRVLAVRAVNDEATGIVETLEQENIRFMPVSDAIERTISIMETDGYLDAENEDYILLNISADSGTMQGHLTEAVENGMERAQEHDPTMEIRIDHSDRETARRAAESGMSPGRYAAWEQADDGRGPEEYAEMPVREIIMGRPPETDHAAPGTPGDPGSVTVPQPGQPDAEQPDQPDGAPKARDDSADRNDPDPTDSPITGLPSEVTRSGETLPEERSLPNPSDETSDLPGMPAPSEKTEDQSGIERPAADPESMDKAPTGIPPEVNEAQSPIRSESGSPGQPPSNEMNGSMSDGRNDAPPGQQSPPNPL